jgi:hypothetical protein
MRLLRSARLAAAMGLLPLAACHRSADKMSVENKADMLTRDLKAQADNMDAMAASMANDSAAAAMRNAADAVDTAADNIQQSADAKIDNMN